MTTNLQFELEAYSPPEHESVHFETDSIDDDVTLLSGSAEGSGSVAVESVRSKGVLSDISVSTGFIGTPVKSRYSQASTVSGGSIDTTPIRIRQKSGTFQGTSVTESAPLRGRTTEATAAADSSLISSGTRSVSTVASVNGNGSITGEIGAVFAISAGIGNSANLSGAVFTETAISPVYIAGSTAGTAELTTLPVRIKSTDSQISASGNSALTPIRARETGGGGIVAAEGTGSSVRSRGVTADYGSNTSTNLAVIRSQPVSGQTVSVGEISAAYTATIGLSAGVDSIGNTSGFLQVTDGIFPVSISSDMSAAGTKSALPVRSIGGVGTGTVSTSLTGDIGLITIGVINLTGQSVAGGEMIGLVTRKSPLTATLGAVGRSSNIPTRQTSVIGGHVGMAESSAVPVRVFSMTDSMSIQSDISTHSFRRRNTTGGLSASTAVILGVPEYDPLVHHYYLSAAHEPKVNVGSDFTIIQPIESDFGVEETLSSEYDISADRRAEFDITESLTADHVYVKHLESAHDIAVKLQATLVRDNDS